MKTKETTMEKEKLEILNMVRDKKITPEEALKLLDAIQLENIRFISDSTKSAKTEIKIITKTNSDKTKTKFEDVNFLKALLEDAKLAKNIIKIDTKNDSKTKILSVEEIDEIMQSVLKESNSEAKVKESYMPKTITIEKPDGSMEIIEL